MNPRWLKTLGPVLLALLLGLVVGTLLQTPPLNSVDRDNIDHWQLPAPTATKADVEADRRLARRNPWGDDGGLSNNNALNDEQQARRESEQAQRKARETTRRRTTWRLVGLSRVESEAQPQVFFVNEAGDWQRLRPGEALPGGWVLTKARSDRATLRGPDEQQRELRLYQPQRLQAELPPPPDNETPSKGEPGADLQEGAES